MQNRFFKPGLIFTLALGLAVGTALAGALASSTKSLTLTATPADLIHSVTKEITVFGSGFTPGSIVTYGIEDVGKWKKDAPAAKDLWLGFVRVKEDGTFRATAGLGRSLWRVKGLSGDYTMVAKNDLDERATFKLTIKPK